MTTHATGYARATAIYGVVFITGCVLMGFEMLGSRYLFPYFGGGIGTWASLISTVLIALAIGYLAGGIIADRYPTHTVIVMPIALAAGYMAIVPAVADPVLSWVLLNAGGGPTGVLTAAALLLLVPLSLLGTLSPVAIRLLIRSTSESGRVAGLIYGISTLGNVVGTLGTTFLLIPVIGSRSITYLFAAVLATCACTLFCAHKQRMPS